MQSAEQRLRLFVRAMDAASNGIMITDALHPEHPIVYVNAGFERISGYSAAEAIGRSGRFLLGDALDQAELEEIRQALRERRTGQAVVECRHQDGRAFWNDLYVAPVPDESGLVTHYVSIIKDITERFQQQRQLAHLTTHDPLTGLANRTLLTDRLEQAIVHAGGCDSVTAVLLIDLDRFKQANDSLGHAAGDRLLQAVATRLESCVREGDTVARTGGNEFAAALIDLTHQQDAVLMAEKMLATLAQPFTIGAEELAITSSIGISCFPSDGRDAGALLRLAEVALHQAKNGGRNDYRCVDDAMNRRAQQAMELEAGLREALQRQELVLHYQPKADLYSGEISGAEALLRWQHPEKGLVPPGDFIPLAEESGAIVPIGEWVLREACRQAKAWQTAGHRPIAVAVNLSARQFRQQDLVERVARALADAGLEPKWLELELTESAVMQDLEAAAEVLRQLKALGVSLAMDDFGTGYSSLGYLKRLPFDCLKIDRSFVNDITTEPDDALIAIAVIAMAHSLRMNVVAEGVETAGQMNYLRNNRCDQIQGYYLAKPMAADRFDDFLRRARQLPQLAGASAQAERVLLVVDDDREILAALKRLLRHGGYRILTATTAEQALEVLATNEVQVVISDQRMPAMSGSELLGRVKELYPHTVRLLFSGYADLPALASAINRGGIFRFLTKPWDDDELRRQLREAFVAYERNLAAQRTVALHREHC